jgi:hypothetical protein
MAIINLPFSSNPQTTGVMINDNVYYIDSSVTNATMNNVIHIGTVSSFGTNSVNVDTGSLNFTMPTQSDYVFFSKNNEINMSSLIGYYAEVKFTNDSTEEAELFSVGVDVSESSK